MREASGAGMAEFRKAIPGVQFYLPIHES